MSEATTRLICFVCKQSKPPTAGMIGELIRPSLFEFIRRRRPECDVTSFVCLEDLAEFRRDYVKEVLQDEIGELTKVDEEVIESLRENDLLSSDIGKQFQKELTFGERLSDLIAEFGGRRFLLLSGLFFLFGSSPTASYW